MAIKFTHLTLPAFDQPLDEAWQEAPAAPPVRLLFDELASTERYAHLFMLPAPSTTAEADLGDTALHTIVAGLRQRGEPSPDAAPAL